MKFENSDVWKRAARLSADIYNELSLLDNYLLMTVNTRQYNVLFFLYPDNCALPPS